ncbi:hypothetical protein COCC4DRAFT_69405 [Bipolaris maydis ATCC 48331]|uniref:Uncharacterized protein n=2 Tax=Cochliobolus heterostrophus TaxID=5016 RepID=M2UCP1_COCH5|nr:uncharacterized protein COCC4DRAFT_69405 [Bipolaris maydis ATCC 48331]EMD91461.1 hypothetical protein COCHEDRAFT_1030281 [Bipolaris maydis C5]ENI08781.1 hypothetical protein COCC4DRAFT_69405 [Bipolaris maydis ATCC 48331]KAH7559303.1 hypothetical protein BM1_04240 [Bipolaris maydis]
MLLLPNQPRFGHSGTRYSFRIELLNVAQALILVACLRPHTCKKTGYPSANQIARSGRFATAPASIGFCLQAHTGTTTDPVKPKESYMLLFPRPDAMVGTACQLRVYIHDGPAYAHAQLSRHSSAGAVEPLALYAECFFYCLLRQSPIAQRQNLLAATGEGSR